MRVLSLILGAFAFFLALTARRSMQRLLQESETAQPGAHFSLNRSRAAWRMHREAFPASIVRRQAMLELLLCLLCSVPLPAPLLCHFSIPQPQNERNVRGDGSTSCYERLN